MYCGPNFKAWAFTLEPRPVSALKNNNPKENTSHLILLYYSYILQKCRYNHFEEMNSLLLMLLLLPLLLLSFIVFSHETLKVIFWLPADKQIVSPFIIGLRKEKKERARNCSYDEIADILCQKQQQQQRRQKWEKIFLFFAQQVLLSKLLPVDS